MLEMADSRKKVCRNEEIKDSHKTKERTGGKTCGEGENKQLNEEQTLWCERAVRSKQTRGCAGRGREKES